MSDAQEYYDWKEDVDDTLCILQEKILNLEKKVKLLEKNNGRTDNY
jgi:hypothetical protein